MHHQEHLEDDTLQIRLSTEAACRTAVPSSSEINSQNITPVCQFLLTRAVVMAIPNCLGSMYPLLYTFFNEAGLPTTIFLLSTPRDISYPTELPLFFPGDEAVKRVA